MGVCRSAPSAIALDVVSEELHLLQLPSLMLSSTRRTMHREDGKIVVALVMVDALSIGKPKFTVIIILSAYRMGASLAATAKLCLASFRVFIDLIA